MPDHENGNPSVTPSARIRAFRLCSLGPDAVLNLTTSAGDLDLAFMPAGTQGFDDLRRDAVAIEVTGTRVLVASLADVIRSKGAANREKDRQALPRLRQLEERLR